MRIVIDPVHEDRAIFLLREGTEELQFNDYVPHKSLIVVKPTDIEREVFFNTLYVFARMSGHSESDFRTVLGRVFPTAGNKIARSSANRLYTKLLKELTVAESDGIKKVPYFKSVQYEIRENGQLYAPKFDFDPTLLIGDDELGDF